ncbi:MAG: CoA transferase [Alphaproteobacteria bacterium]|nr:CoA transferase [Alphaproteobacteria bacterium]
MDRAFAHVRVLDFTRVLAGPFASFQLALQGAEVIKVEQPGGEDTRNISRSRDWSERKMAPIWMSVNGGKRSITLDLQKPEAIAVVKKLAAEADVVVENFRPGVMDRLGIGWKQLSAINPRLIYCAMSGFGQDGPERGTPSYDGMIQAMSGLMSMTGTVETGPLRAGFAAADMITGINGAYAMATALFQRTHTGRGQFVDVAMLDSMMGLLAQQVAEYTTTGEVAGRVGNLSPSRKPTADLFKGRDGFVLLAVLTEKQYRILFTTLGREEVFADPRFADWFARMQNAAALKAVIEEALQTDSAAAWEARLKAADIPCARVWGIDEILTHPQLAHRDIVQTVQSEYGSLRLTGPAFKLREGGSGGLDRPPPRVGEHTGEVLRQAGFSAEEIATLQASGALG